MEKHGFEQVAEIARFLRDCHDTTLAEILITRAVVEAEQLFGKRSLTVGMILIEQIELYERFSKPTEELYERLRMIIRFQADNAS